MSPLRLLVITAFLATAGLGASTVIRAWTPAAPPTVTAPWYAYGADAGGSRYSPLDQIDRSTVADLAVAWTYQTGERDHDETAVDGASCANCHNADVKFEATPIIAAGRLVLSTPFNRVIALDPATGEEAWTADPRIDRDESFSEGFVSRGVSFWEDSSRTGGPCRSVVIQATIDARLIALDAATGRRCRAFGEGGEVDLTRGIEDLVDGEVEVGEYEVTSPPAVVGDVVVVGSSMGDNRRVNVERGTVRAYDVRTGALRWSWDPIPRRPGQPGYETWTPDGARRTGAANAWSVLAADPTRDLVFVPTGSAAPDFYGGERLGDNLYANSVVALRAATGEIAWHFQVVHHDLWDYDVASQPVLVDVRRNGTTVPAVAVTTKMGHVFVLHRETGEPLLPIEERPVPTDGVHGERPSPTQPFPVLPRPLHPTSLTPDEAWGVTEADRAACRAQIAALRHEGIFTPPSEQGTLIYPGYGGGTNWGSAAFHKGRGILITTVIRLPFWVRLHPRAEWRAARQARPDGVQFTGQEGTPYGMSRAAVVSPGGLPCAPPPWGTLVALDVSSGEVMWERPVGRFSALADRPEAESWGSLLAGGAMVTAGGIVFIAAADDDTIRAFDVETGDLRWSADLPAGGNATPMTYMVDGRQFLVIAAGGHSRVGTQGDYVVAFALRER